MAQRNYTTWEEELTSDRCELHGLEDELVAVVDRVGGSWIVTTPDGEVQAARPDKETAMRAAEAFLGKAKA